MGHGQAHFDKKDPESGAGPDGWPMEHGGHPRYGREPSPGGSRGDGGGMAGGQGPSWAEEDVDGHRGQTSETLRLLIYTEMLQVWSTGPWSLPETLSGVSWVKTVSIMKPRCYLSFVSCRHLH